MAIDKRATRLGVLGLVGVILFSLIGVRLWFLQTVKADELQQLSTIARTRTVRIPPERGRIFDVDGRILAELPAAKADEEQLLKDRTGVPKDIAKIMVKVANETRRLRRSHELPGCIDARGLIAWATKFTGKEGDGEDVVARLKASARITVLYTACGTDSEGYIREDAATVVLNLIEAHTPK